MNFEIGSGDTAMTPRKTRSLVAHTLRIEEREAAAGRKPEFVEENAISSQFDCDGNSIRHLITQCRDRNLIFDLALHTWAMHAIARLARMHFIRISTAACIFSTASHARCDGCMSIMCYGAGSFHIVYMAI